jgi:hypothetical protein
LFSVGGEGVVVTKCSVASVFSVIVIHMQEKDEV